MYRRISVVIEFKLPDFKLREKIWKNLVPTNVKVAEDINWGEIAIDYEITGHSFILFLFYFILFYFILFYYYLFNFYFNF